MRERLHDGIFLLVMGALFIACAGWFGREMAGKVDYDRPATPEERLRDARRGAMWARLIGASAFVYGVWHVVIGR